MWEMRGGAVGLVRAIRQFEEAERCTVTRLDVGSWTDYIGVVERLYQVGKAPEECLLVVRRVAGVAAGHVRMVGESESVERR